MALRTPLLASAATLTCVAGVVFYTTRDDPPARPQAECGPTRSSPEEIGLDRAGAATLCLLNRERARQRLPPLVTNGLLAAAAVLHSRDMVARGYFEHDSPEGRSPQDRIRATGYGRGTSSSTGENIAWGTGEEATPAAIVAQWMASPPHRADILRPAFREIGVGIALGAPARDGKRAGATYTTNFGGVFDASLESG